MMHLYMCLLSVSSVVLGVLILVVMDDALVHTVSYHSGDDHIVLILVVMDDALVPI